MSQVSIEKKPIPVSLSFLYTACTIIITGLATACGSYFGVTRAIAVQDVKIDNADKNISRIEIRVAQEDTKIDQLMLKMYGK